MGQMVGMEQATRISLLIVLMGCEPIVLMTAASSCLRPMVVTFTRPVKRWTGQPATRQSGCTRLEKLGAHGADQITGSEGSRCGNAAAASSRASGSTPEKTIRFLYSI